MRTECVAGIELKNEQVSLTCSAVVLISLKLLELTFKVSTTSYSTEAATKISSGFIIYSAPVETFGNDKISFCGDMSSER
jgi:hypothetical protein